jgi:hypothetical protein
MNLVKAIIIGAGLVFAALFFGGDNKPEVDGKIRFGGADDDDSQSDED